MPYIDEEGRQHFDDGLPYLIHKLEERGWQVGDINYVFTRIGWAFIRYLADGRGTVRYAHLNTIMGVFECAKLEFYKRIGGPLELNAHAKNGDVYR
jgi:hypothetical protein